MTFDPVNRLQKIDWSSVRHDLNLRGWAQLNGILSADECRSLQGIWEQEDCFRSEVNMQRHNFGQGRYRYFNYPLPRQVAEIRTVLYERLVTLANDWMQKLKHGHTYPATLPEFLRTCHEHGQQRPTPLMLQYRPGDYNRLHQDQYGPMSFPLQALIMLSSPADFEGGQFVLTETRPRTQTRAHVLTPGQGSIILFAGSRRPVPSARGYSAVTLRHGVSEVFSGHRMTLGIIFHDAA